MKTKAQPSLPGLEKVQTTIILGMQASQLVSQARQELQDKLPGQKITNTDILRGFIHEGLVQWAAKHNITVAKDFDTFK